MADDMPSRTTEDQVLDIAIQIEQLARDFYEALAGAVHDPQILQLCHRLAADEDRHRETFRQLGEKLIAQGTPILLTTEQTLAARRRLQDQIVPTSDVIRQVACGGNVVEALTLAVRMEAETARFYSHIAAKLPPDNEIEAIVAEERAHLRLLSGMRCGVAIEY